MVSYEFALIGLTGLTGGSILIATSIAVMGDTRRNPGQRVIVERLAQVALVAATALVALLGFPQ